MRRIDIITGASSGIGEEFARQYFFLTQSDEMWLVARRKERLQKLADELNNLSAKNEAEQTSSNKDAFKHYSAGKDKTKFPKVRFFAFDLSGTEGVAQLQQVLAQESPLCVAMLFNNAGFGTYGTFAETPVEREMAMIDLNCTALTGICGVCLPYMQSGSQILNTASLAAFLPLGNFAVYAASKAYVLSFSYALSAELKPSGIHVCALCPGSVSTEFANVASNGARSEVLHGCSVQKTVSHALKCLRQKRHAALMSPKWKVTAFLARFVPRYFGAWFTYKFHKRPHR